jgi:hypothetical protein
MQAMTQKHALESTQVSDSASRKEYVYPCHDARRVHRVVWVWVWVWCVPMSIPVSRRFTAHIKLNVATCSTLYT